MHDTVEAGRTAWRRRWRPALVRRSKRIERRLEETLFSDKMAAAQVVMFLITAAIFLPAITLLIIYLDDTGTSQPKTTGALHNQAAVVLDQLTSSTGALPDGTTAWDTSSIRPHTLTEVGLLSDSGHRLSAGKIQKIQSGGMLEDHNNAYLDYPELKQALGLGDRVDFYLRSYPIIANSVDDPYGTDPIKGFHVAYIANLSSGQPYDNLDADTWDHKIDTATADFVYPTTRASQEIAALNRLQLTTNANDELNGFDGDWYQPANADASYLLNQYTSADVVTGDVIADTDRLYGPLGGERPYVEWFIDDYFNVTEDAYRYDAIIFGTGVDHTRWNTAATRDKLDEFVLNDGVIIFLGTDKRSPGLFQDCGTTSDCLLRNATSQNPLTIPDVSNPLLDVPNVLGYTDYKKIGNAKTQPFDFWSICGTEREGFLPIVMDDQYNIDHLSTHSCPTTEVHKDVLGASASDKFGDSKGIVIATTWDVTEGKSGRLGESTRFFSNVLNYGLVRSAYMAYGPSLPDGSQVEEAERTMLVETERGSVLDIRVSVYMWRT